MSPSQKRWVVGALVVSHALTAWVSVWLASAAYRMKDKLTAISRIAASHSVVESQTNQGPSISGRDALLMHLCILEELGPASTLPPAELDMDRMFALIRLWKLETALRMPQESDIHLEQARHLCLQAPFKDCSNSGLERSLEVRLLASEGRRDAGGE